MLAYIFIHKKYHLYILSKHYSHDAQDLLANNTHTLEHLVQLRSLLSHQGPGLHMALSHP